MQPQRSHVLVSLLLLVLVLALQCASAWPQQGPTLAQRGTAPTTFKRMLQHKQWISSSGDGPPSKQDQALAQAAVALADAAADSGGTTDTDTTVQVTRMSPAEIAASNAPVVLLEIGTPAAPKVDATSRDQGHARSPGAPPPAAASPASPPAAAAVNGTAATAVALRDASTNSGSSSVAVPPSGSDRYLVGHGGYWYVREDPEVPLGLPVHEPPGEPMSRWVMTAWSVSNFSSPAMLSEDVMHEVQGMITNFSSMAPGQVQLAASAMLTLPLSISRLPSWTAAENASLVAGVRAAAAQWAGGYDPALITIHLSAPDYGVVTTQFQAAASEAVVTRQRAAHVLTNRPQPGKGAGSNSSSSNSSSGVAAARGRRLLRRLLQGGAAPAAAAGVPVWVSYTRLAPLNVTDVQAAVAAACGVADLQAGLDLAGTPCAAQLTRQLRTAGVVVGSGGAGVTMMDAPMITLDIRLAIGVTEAQAAVGTDRALSSWLSLPRNIRSAIAISGVPDPIGPDALLKWLLKPEIWEPPVTPVPPNNPLSKPANAVGVALGGAAFVMASLGGLLLFRRAKRRSAQDKLPHTTSSSAGSSAGSSRQRRRRQGKRRYLNPETPSSSAGAAAAAAAAASTTSAAADAAAPASSGSDGAADDAAQSPDQIRPALQELGDSVTSAVRYEDDDDEQQQDGQPARGSGGVADGSNSPSGDGVAGGSSRARVLAARAALLAERQAAGSAGADGQLVGAAAGTAAAAKAAIGAAALTQAGRRRGGLVSPFAAAQAQDRYTQPPQQQQQQQQPPPPPHQQQEHSAFLLQPARSSARVQPLSPFAVAYDFSQLLGSSTGTPMAAAAAAATDGGNGSGATRSNGNLQGVGGTCIALQPDGSFNVAADDGASGRAHPLPSQAA